MVGIRDPSLDLEISGEDFLNKIPVQLAATFT
jgi:hypothetical protein